MSQHQLKPKLIPAQENCPRETLLSLQDLAELARCLHLEACMSMRRLSWVLLSDVIICCITFKAMQASDYKEVMGQEAPCVHMHSRLFQAQQDTCTCSYYYRAARTLNEACHLIHSPDVRLQSLQVWVVIAPDSASKYVCYRLPVQLQCRAAQDGQARNVVQNGHWDKRERYLRHRPALAISRSRHCKILQA